jgi:hypothetical protein
LEYVRNDLQFFEAEISQQRLEIEQRTLDINQQRLEIERQQMESTGRLATAAERSAESTAQGAQATGRLATAAKRSAESTAQGAQATGRLAKAAEISAVANVSIARSAKQREKTGLATLKEGAKQLEDDLILRLALLNLPDAPTIAPTPSLTGDINAINGLTSLTQGLNSGQPGITDNISKKLHSIRQIAN